MNIEPKELSDNALAEFEADLARQWAPASGPCYRVKPLLQHVAHMKQEEDFMYTLNCRLAKILNDTANVLKGPPDPLALHSTHDLAEVAIRMMDDARRWQFLRDWSNDKERMRLFLQISSTAGIDSVMDDLIAKATAK